LLSEIKNQFENKLSLKAFSIPLGPNKKDKTEAKQSE